MNLSLFLLPLIPLEWGTIVNQIKNGETIATWEKILKSEEGKLPSHINPIGVQISSSDCQYNTHISYGPTRSEVYSGFQEIEGSFLALLFWYSFCFRNLFNSSLKTISSFVSFTSNECLHIPVVSYHICPSTAMSLPAFTKNFSAIDSFH